MKTNEEINRYIHERILNKCWHKVTRKWDGIIPHDVCSRCRKEGDALNLPLLDYCSDNSPRKLLNEVVARLQENEEIGIERYGVELDVVMIGAGIKHRSVMQAVGFSSIATAEQIARACVAAHEQENNG